LDLGAGVSLADQFCAGDVGFGQGAFACGAFLGASLALPPVVFLALRVAVGFAVVRLHVVSVSWISSTSSWAGSCIRFRLGLDFGGGGGAMGCFYRDAASQANDIFWFRALAGGELQMDVEPRSIGQIVNADGGDLLWVIFLEDQKEPA
jgi:hypothetical protein